MTTACLVLASGLSQRFGSDDKLLATLKGQALLAYCLDTAKAVSFDGYFVVTPMRDPRAELAISRGFQVIDNPRPQTGIGDTIAIGAQYVLARSFDRACILLGDMPFVTPGFLKTLLSTSRNNMAVFSHYEGRDQAPAVFSGAALRRLEELSGDRGASSLGFETYETYSIDLPPEMVPDFDTPEDFETS